MSTNTGVRAAQHERVRRRHERERRHDHFVAWLQIESSAAISSAAVQECVSRARGCAEMGLQPRLTAPRETTVPGKLTAGHRLLNVRELPPREVRTIEGNHSRRSYQGDSFRDLVSSICVRPRESNRSLATDQRRDARRVTTPSRSSVGKVRSNDFSDSARAGPVPPSGRTPSIRGCSHEGDRARAGRTAARRDRGASRRRAV